RTIYQSLLDTRFSQHLRPRRLKPIDLRKKELALIAIESQLRVRRLSSFGPGWGERGDIAVRASNFYCLRAADVSELDDILRRRKRSSTADRVERTVCFDQPGRLRLSRTESRGNQDSDHECGVSLLLHSERLFRFKIWILSIRGRGL